jgi:hypothetical protein
MYAYGGAIFIFFSVRPIAGKLTIRLFATAHETQTTQTVNKLSFGATREDSQGLVASYALAGSLSCPVPGAGPGALAINLRG